MIEPVYVDAYDIAAEIRNEMVCCDTYDQLEAAGFQMADYRELKRESNYHAICHYGEWAARIVEKRARSKVLADAGMREQHES